jgi:preprotein translocase subunit SecA
MFAWILKKIVGSKNQRELRQMLPIVKKINDLEEQLKSLPDDALREKTQDWKDRLSKISDPVQLDEELQGPSPHMEHGSFRCPTSRRDGAPQGPYR